MKGIKKVSPLKAIFCYCKTCPYSNGQRNLGCTLTDCALHPFRTGRNPYLKKQLNEEQLQKLR